MALFPAAAAAQSDRGGVRFEMAAGVHAARETWSFVGGGAAVPAGNYVRSFARIGGGPALSDTPLVAGRLELGIRFLTDPFHQQRRAAYLGAGLGVRGTHRLRNRTEYVFLLVGLEGRTRDRWIPALEVGLGDGARLTLVIRQGRRGYR